MADTYPVMSEAEEFYYPGNKTGVLVIHGFTGTTQSVHFLGKQLAEQGFTVFGPRLAGHGTDPEDMEGSTYQEWIQTVERGLEKLQATCEEVFVTGLSMGGTLTLYLAAEHPEIKGIMPINAATHMPDMIENYEALKNTGTRFVEGIGSDIKQEGIEELAYQETPVKSMKEGIDLFEMVRGKLAEVNTPAMIFSSAVDHVVPPENSREIYESISSDVREFVMLENSYHVATLDNDKELIAEKCIAFIKEIQRANDF
ncbi:carboxylesterase [Lentibacillus sp. CBA3610]|uniref:alpha/beta hydrolase n=1 Tax=Lentibacillus sp. CBA3610 TaxID=2518176 RepID=UPI0015959B76|nr:alpha/beta fold hydrolase [Lentibacillus sp. CBA3610]QKY70063.1 alpha/beta fold hydrolase [Lentibacillus sp. CBA3610]